MVSARAKEDLVVALADLYLDTDARWTLPRLAQQIVSAGISEHELTRLWRSQVTPAVHWNLKSSAGAWSGFDRRWLLHEVERRRGRGLETLPWLGKLVHRFRADGVEVEFQCALVFARRLAQVPEPEREMRVEIWLALFQVYYQASEPAQRSARQRVETQRIEPNALVEEFRMVCDLLAELLTHGEHKPAAEARVAAWLDRLGL